jgi:hypothetical protein
MSPLFFSGGRLVTPHSGKHAPHTRERFPMCFPVFPQKGDVRKLFSRRPPHSQSVGNMGGAPPTLGNTSHMNTAYVRCLDSKKLRTPYNECVWLECPTAWKRNELLISKTQKQYLISIFLQSEEWFVVHHCCWRFATSGSHSPQESTRRPIYTITEAPGRSWRPRKRSQPHGKIIK